MLSISHDILGKFENRAVLTTIRYQGLVPDTLHYSDRGVDSGDIVKTRRHSEREGKLRHFHSSYYRRSVSARYTLIPAIKFICSSDDDG